MRIIEGWFITFADTPPGPLQGYGLIKKGYRHIVLTRYDPVSESFVVFETMHGGSKVGVLTLYQWDFVIRHSTETFIITTDINPAKMLLPRLLTCVGAAKHHIGVRWPLVFTPWQLRSALLKHDMASKFDIDAEIEELE